MILEGCDGLCGYFVPSHYTDGPGGKDTAFEQVRNRIDAAVEPGMENIQISRESTWMGDEVLTILERNRNGVTHPLFRFIKETHILGENEYRFETYHGESQGESTWREQFIYSRMTDFDLGSAGLSAYALVLGLEVYSDSIPRVLHLGSY